MTALLPVRGRLLLCRTTGPTSLQHSTVATLTQQQLRISQLCSQLQLTQPLQILRLPTPLRQTRHRLTQLQQPQLRQIQLPLPRHLLILRPQRPHQRRPHLRLQHQQTPRLPILRLLHPLRQIQPQLSQP